MSRVDVLIVGSGFGGAVMAARLGAHVRAVYGGARSVHVLDKGVDPTGRFDPESPGGSLNAEGNRFRQTLDPAYLTTYADVFTDLEAQSLGAAPSMNVVGGKGFGGGSNLYCGVSLRAPRATFEQVREGRRLWPAMYSREALDPYYARAERTLRVHRMHWSDHSAPHWQLTTKRDYVFAEACRRVGATAVPLKLADERDANEGWWTQGQRFEGRQNLTKNYLAEALASGVTFASGSEVQTIEPTADGYVARGVDRRGGGARPFEVECRMLVLAGGAVASTALLLRSRDAFGDARPLDLGAASGAGATLGRHLSSNGDYGVTGTVGRDYELDVEGGKGKPMSSFTPSYFREHGFLIIPFHTPALYFALGNISTLLPAADPEAVGRRSTAVANGADGRPLRDWGMGYKERLRLFSRRFLTMGCLAYDACEGEIRLDGRGDVEVRWHETDRATEARWAAAVRAMRSMYRALGGEMWLDTYRKDGTVNTSHPLGGCRMAEVEEGDHGVVDPFGESFANPNLFVMDGSIVPSALAVNPSLTIAAIAECVADRIIRGDGTRPLDERLAG